MSTSQPVASLRDPIHGFIYADPLERALIDSKPLQRLRSIRQLGFAYLVFPGAEHSRFGHALGAMELAGRVYDAVALRDVQVEAAHEKVLMMRDALETFVAMDREITRLESDYAIVREDLAKRVAALKRLRELTLGQKEARP